MFLKLFITIKFDFIHLFFFSRKGYKFSELINIFKNILICKIFKNLF